MYGPPRTCKLEHPGDSVWRDVPQGLAPWALLTDVVNGASAELPIELLGSQAP